VSGVFLTEQRESGFDEVDLAKKDGFELGADEALG
jgi:hypothetical protein